MAYTITPAFDQTIRAKAYMVYQIKQYVPRESYQFFSTEGISDTRVPLFAARVANNSNDGSLLAASNITEGNADIDLDKMLIAHERISEEQIVTAGNFTSQIADNLATGLAAGVSHRVASLAAQQAITSGYTTAFDLSAEIGASADADSPAVASRKLQEALAAMDKRYASSGHPKTIIMTPEFFRLAAQSQLYGSWDFRSAANGENRAPGMFKDLEGNTYISAYSPIFFANLNSGTTFGVLEDKYKYNFDSANVRALILDPYAIGVKENMSLRVRTEWSTDYQSFVTVAKTLIGTKVLQAQGVQVIVDTDGS